MAIKQNLTDFFSVQNLSPVLRDHNTGILGSQYWYKKIFQYCILVLFQYC